MGAQSCGLYLRKAASPPDLKIWACQQLEKWGRNLDLR